MKRLVLGDIHGHWDTLEKIYYKENPDEVILVGDYFDSFHAEANAMCECFSNILALRKIHLAKNTGNFIMLLGNHDLHYIIDTEKYSGWNWHYAGWAKTKLNECIDNGIITKCFIDNVNKTIYTHAGVSNCWLKEYCNGVINVDEVPTIYQINDIPITYFKFNSFKGYSIYGDNPSSSPVWIRPRALSNDLYSDDNGIIWNQVVGHTHMKHCVYIDTNNEATNNKILVIDALPADYVVESIDNNGVITETNIVQNEL